MPPYTPRREEASFVGAAMGIVEATDVWEVRDADSSAVYEFLSWSLTLPLPAKNPSLCASQKTHRTLRHIRPWLNQSESIPESTCVDLGVSVWESHRRSLCNNGLQGQSQLGSNPSTTAHKPWLWASQLCSLNSYVLVSSMGILCLPTLLFLCNWHAQEWLGEPRILLLLLFSRWSTASTQKGSLFLWIFFVFKFLGFFFIEVILFLQKLKCQRTKPKGIYLPIDLLSWNNRHS